MADLNRQGFLPAQIANEIIAKTQTSSAIMRLAKSIDLPGTGVSIPVIVSDPEAGWVGETGKKPVSAGEVTPKLMQAYKLAVIVPFSKELTRDASGLYNAMVQRLPQALAKKFDQTVIGAVAAPGANFDTFATATAQDITPNAYDAIIAGYSDIADHGNANKMAIGAKGNAALLTAKDSTGRPLFNAASESGVSSVAGFDTVVGDGIYKAADATAGTPATLGVLGDFTQAVYGTVNGVEFSISEEATLDLGNGQSINLWQQNMVAVRAEIEVGFRANVSAFNLLTD